MREGMRAQIFYNDTPDHVCVARGTVTKINDHYVELFDDDHQNAINIMLSRIVRVVEG